MKYLASLFLGAFVGAVIALLFAPSSGEEFRTNLKSQADVQVARAKEGLQTGVQSVKDGVNRINDSLRKPADEATPEQVAA